MHISMATIGRCSVAAKEAIQLEHQDRHRPNSPRIQSRFIPHIRFDLVSIAILMHTAPGFKPDVGTLYFPPGTADMTTSLMAMIVAAG